ncbi:hypothetical protein KFE25_011574 [Diacronema lutheri]|uniref:Testis-expressed sequence 9 protein n=3 Tax=Diacronema lutheri TaxID=2081491 RepID=A0A8J5XKD1_DIALT|nr:hypothetical protein KFE25_011574 [Diacronema lutheri]
MDELEAREAQLLALNEELDRRKAALVKGAEATIFEQQQRMREFDCGEGPAGDEFDSPARDAGVRSLSASGEENEAPLDMASAVQSEGSAERPSGRVAPSTAESSPFAAPTRRKDAPSAAQAALPGAPAARSAPSGGVEATELPEVTGMGPEAAMRYYRARVQVQNEELERLRALMQRTASESKEWELRASEATGARAKLERAARDASARAEREHKANAELRARAEQLEAQLGGTRREADGVTRDAKARSADAKAKDVRLNRALEELDKTRGALAAAQADARAASGPAAQAERAALSAENGRLRKQKAELLLAFKKQAKLVDVLKRQKLHVEAARALQFTEEEFSKALQLGEPAP